MRIGREGRRSRSRDSVAVRCSIVIAAGCLVGVACSGSHPTGGAVGAAPVVSNSTTSTSSPSGAYRVRDLGVVHTRLGDAHAYCGGDYTPLCSPTIDPPTQNVRQVALFYEVCTPRIQSYLDSIGSHFNGDRAIRQLVGGGPPHGGIWTEVACRKPPSSMP